MIFQQNVKKLNLRITTITKSYGEQHYKHFSVYGRPSFRSTNVFWEYFDLLVFNSAEKEITEVIKYEPTITGYKIFKI